MLFPESSCIHPCESDDFHYRIPCHAPPLPAGDYELRIEGLMETRTLRVEDGIEPDAGECGPGSDAGP